MSGIVMSTWGKEITVEVRFDLLDDERVTSKQAYALGVIFVLWDAVNGALDALKSYCLENDGNMLTSECGTARIDDIFDVVEPYSLFVVRDDSKRSVALMCHYRLDPEHGLALLFENERLTKIGPEDIAF
ncbi:hypothetical protein ADJ70_10505 [Olsenella sp. oral taxon 807]|uniref:DUF6985 domain-containing protein n=1 Tax=Olsenella sp. oral taxon 807 TaxID=712411 RepID=UPI00067A36BE|nr:hypothetical protein [Olsenella sp. oral taxon 807]AKT49268.1 hypothetical protein ADJ70_10505 [Olsenella sp. oral taxon 807]